MSISKRKRQQGFTLMELMIVIAILAILGAMAVATLLPNVDKANVQRAKTDIETIVGALNIYKLDNGDYPGTDEGLNALVSRPASARNWQEGGYLKLPDDPWKRPYQYVFPGENGVFDVYSFGRDGEPGGEGLDADIGNWTEEK